jgi:HEAT repeat protein
MPGKRSFEDQLAALDGLRQQPPEARTGPLRKALAHRNNYVAAKAAEIVRDFSIAELTPDLLSAFNRFFTDPVKSDPQCWAKNALGRALSTLEHQDPEVFLRGMRHVQMEPVWGGRSDTAGTLRGTCALALAQCRSRSDGEVLNHLLELFADNEKSVRVEAARALDELGTPAAAHLLRLRAVLASDEPEVLGACYSGILHIEGKSAIAWLSRFLTPGDDLAAEAALAIASDRSPEAFHALRRRFLADSPPESRKNDLKMNDSWFLSVLLSAIALTRQPEAHDFLLDQVRAESLHAEAAIEVILRSGASPEAVRQLEQAAAGNPRLAQAVAAQRPKSL